jgi:RHS repeat-associated protein
MKSQGCSSVAHLLNRLFGHRVVPSRNSYLSRRWGAARKVWQRLESLESRLLLTAVSWDGGGDGVNWTSADNWSNNAVPTSADDVTVSAAGAITLSGAQAAHSLTMTGGDSISLLNSTLTLGPGASNIAHFALTGSGSIITSGDLTISGSSSMANSAVLGGPGTIFLTGTLTETGSGTIQTEMQVTGDLIMSNGTFFIGGAAGKVRVLDGGALNLFSTSIQAPNGGQGVFIEGGGTLNSNGASNFTNGVVSVDGGVVNAVNNPTFGSSLVFTSSSLHDATFHVAGGASVVFNGSSQQNAVSGTITGTGPGQVIINGDNSFVLASDTVFNFAAGQLQFQNAASIDGPGTLTNAGFVQGSPTLKTKVLNTGTFAPTGTLTFSGASAELRILAGGAFGSTGVGLGGDASSVGLIVESGGLLTGGFASGGVPVQVLGGTVKTIADASMQFNGPTSLVSAFLDTTAGNLIFFQSGSNVTVGGVLTGSGPANTVVYGNGASTLTVAPEGAVFNYPAGLVRFSQATITGGTLTNTGFIQGSPIIATKVLNTGTFATTGTMNFSGASAELRILAGGTIGSAGLILGGNATSVGLIIESGGLLTGGFTSGGVPVQVLGGTIKTIPDTSMQFNGPVSLVGAILDTTAGNQIFFQGTSATSLSGTITGTGPASTVTFASGATINIPAGGAALDFAPGMAVFQDVNVNGPGVLTTVGELLISANNPILRTELRVEGKLNLVGTNPNLILDTPRGLVRIVDGGQFFGSSNVNGHGIAATNGGAGILIEQGGLFQSAGGLTVTAPFSNLGTVLVDSALRLNGPVAQISGSAGNIALTGGTWVQHGNSFLDFLNTSITALGAGADVTVGSGNFRFPAITGLTNNAGTLRLIEAQELPLNSAFNNSGTVSLAAGTQLTVGAFTQTSAGTTEFGIAGTGATQIGQIIGTAAATLAGAAHITVAGGFTPQAGQNFPLMTFTSHTGEFETVEGLNIGHADLFEDVYTGTNFSLNSLVNAADLDVNTVTPPVSGIAGQNVSFSYSVNNTGGFVTPVSSWTDTVYLSLDGTLDAGDIVLTTVAHSGAVAAGGSYTQNVAVPLVGVLPGDYKLIVVADSRGFVADTDRDNNALAGTAFAVTVPTLTPGVAFNGSIAGGRDLFFEVTLPALQTPRFTFTGAVAGQAEIYESLGEIPTRAQFDEGSFTATSSVQRVAGETTVAATYFVLLHGRENAGAGQNFSLIADGIDFDLTATSVASGANIGSVTTTLTGSQFSPDTTFTLVPASGPSRVATAVFFHSGQSADATFDLTGLAAGTYGIRASDGATTDTLAGAFVVTSGGTPGTLKYNLAVPGVVRPPFTAAAATLTYENTGDTDLPAPLFNILGENVRMRLADDTGFLAATSTLSNGRAFGVLELLGVSGGLAGVLSPGEKGSIQILFEPIDATAHVSSTLQAIALADSNDPLDFTALKQEMQPENIANDAWDAIFANYLTATGGTLAGYHAMLVDNANYLGQFGAVSPEVTGLVGFQLDQADSFGEISQRYTQSEMGRGNSTPFGLRLQEDSIGNVTISQDGASRGFLKLGNGLFQSAGDDPGVLTRSVQGVFTLTETGGKKTVFRAADGLMDFIEDPAGNRISSTRNGSGQLLSLTNSLTGDTATFTHNVQGRISSITDSVGRVTSFTYDAGGEHLTSITSPDGTTTYTYVTGQGLASEHALASITTPRGVTTTFTYDAQGRLTSRTAGSGNDAVPLTFTYPEAGLLTVTDASLNSTELFRGLGGNPMRVIDALGNTSSAVYDSRGRVIQTTSADGTSAKAGYNAAGVLGAITNPDRTQTNILSGGDPARIQTITDPRGGVTTFEHDAAGHLLSTVLPDGSSRTYEYDANGLLIASTDGDGDRTTFSPTSVGLVTRRTLADGTTVDYTYDAHRNLLTAADAQGVTTFTYDSADRVTSAAYPNGKSITITYDSFGRRATVADQNGYTVRYSYDSLGRLDTLRDTTSALLVNYDYNALGQLIKETRGNGSTTDYTYDATGRTATIVHKDGATVLAQFAYTYDALNRVKTATTLDGVTSYDYDLNGQLSAVSLPGGRTITYAYDANGNRTVVTDSARGTDNYTTNTGDAYIAVGGETLAYDRAGRLISSTDGGVTTTYTYDKDGQLTGVITPGSIISFDYDALGNRIGKTENGVRTDFALDPAGLGVVFGQYAGATAVNYATGRGMASRTTGGSDSYYHFDAAGNTAALSDASGAAIATYDYLPFGEIAAQTGSVDQPFTFDGQLGVQDDGGNLFQMRARIYDAGLGRFTTRDPIDFNAGDTDLYRFVGNDPVNRSDPSGLIDAFVGVGASLIAGGGVTVGSGVFVNSDDIFDTGFFYSAGGGAGFDISASLSGGFSEDISGESFNVNGGAGSFSATVTTDTDGKPTGASGSLSLGSKTFAGGSVTRTETFKLSPRGVLTALGFPKPNNPERRPEILFRNKLDKLITKNGNSELFNELVQNGLNSVPPKSRQDAILEAIAFLKKHGIYDPNVNPGTTFTVRPHDPNNIIGPSGAGADALPDTIAPGQTRFDGFVGDGNPYSYTIEFENKPDADVPAQVVTVTQTLDADLDLSTFTFASFGFGAFVANVPGGQAGASFTTTVDATATLGLLVKIDATLDTQTRLLTVTYTSLDPLTHDVPLDPFAGFLPPDNDNGDGDGFLTYSVQPKAALANATDFTAIASIVFDTEDPIATPTVTNTLDILTPTSTVAALPATSSRPNFTVSWSAADDIGGSGISSVTLFFTDNGGQLQTASALNTAGGFRFTGEVGHTYEFFSAAIDNVGNIEAVAGTPDATLTVIAPTLVSNKDVNGKPHVFTDTDGDTYTVAVSGPGTMNIVLLNPDIDGKGSIDQLLLTDATSKSKVTVAVKRGAQGDGIVTIGDLDVTGDLGAFTAKSSDLTVDGVVATGVLGAVSIRDMIAVDALAGLPGITAAGTVQSKTKFSLIARAIGDGAFRVGNPIASIKAASIGDGTITAPSLASLATGTGAMNADLAITGNVGAISVKTSVNAGNWSGAQFGAISILGGAFDIDLTSTGFVTSLTLKAGALTGDLVARNFGAVSITGGDFTGSISSSTTFAALGKTPAVAKLAVTGGNITGDVTVLGALGPVTVTESKVGAGGGLSGDLTARSFGAIKLTGGNFSGSITSTTTAAALGKIAALAGLSITGGDLVGVVSVLGNLGAVSLKSDKALAGGSIAGGTVTAAKIASLSIVKNISQSLILAGADLGADHALGGSGADADTFAPGTIGAVSIGGNVVAGVIAAGLTTTNAVLKDGDDAILGGITSSIASLVVKGAADSASYFATGIFKAKPKIGGVTIDLTIADPRFLIV